MKWFASLFILFFFIFFDGSTFYSPYVLNESDKIIIYELRLPRTLLAFLVGGVLAVCGHIYQLLFKNALATPFTLGVASASSLGATLAIFLGFTSLVTPFALAFSILPMLILFYFLGHKSGFSTTKILLAGVIMSYLCSSFVVLLQVLSPGDSLREILFWLLGDLNIVGVEALYILVPSVFVFLLLCKKYGENLVKLSVGEVFAINMGVDSRKIHTIYISMTTVIIALCVSICGPIAFVGIIIPHWVRAMSEKRIELMTGDLFVCGGLFLSLCEYGTQTLLVSYQIPVGVITSLVGAPFFIILLLRLNFR